MGLNNAATIPLVLWHPLSAQIDCVLKNFTMCFSFPSGSRLTNVWVHKRKYSGVLYNERTLKRTVFLNKIKMLQQTQMLQWTRKNTIGQCSTRVRMMCRAFPLSLESQSSYLLPFVRFSYQFSSVICLFVPLAIKIFFLIILLI